ncbi:MAG TPA: DUF1223 domain-containing protein [Candidatus Sulfotelmatobacter sp.]|nr:DUF1223 domain-containing protein [Candidatus Sulfotelmatobacter sp.]
MRCSVALLLCAILFSLVSLAMPAATADVPVLIELFTSEGCSSCPPADGILQRLDEFQPIAGAQLVVLSEHVTYWDQLGWKDPNSSSVFTERQSSYENELGVKEGPYTPQFIVDGSQSVSLDKVQQLEEAVNKAKAEARVALRIGEITVDPSDPTTVRTHIESDVNSEKHNADVYVALALNHVESQVLRGENGGQHLVHVAVVQQLTKVGKLPRGKSFAQDVQLKLKPGENLKNVRLVAFAQESGPGKLLGVAMRKAAN